MHHGRAAMKAGQELTAGLTTFQDCGSDLFCTQLGISHVIDTG